MKGHSGTSLSIRHEGPVQTNLVLLRVLETEFGVSLSADNVLAHLEGDDEEESFDPSPAYEFLKESCTSVPEFAIRDVAVLGNFAFQKMAMVRDLQQSSEQLASSDLIAALDCKSAEARISSLGVSTSASSEKHVDLPLRERR
jgi:hypothetical protein